MKERRHHVDRNEGADEIGDETAAGVEIAIPSRWLAAAAAVAIGLGALGAGVYFSQAGGDDSGADTPPTVEAALAHQTPQSADSAPERALTADPVGAEAGSPERFPSSTPPPDAEARRSSSTARMAERLRESWSEGSVTDPYRADERLQQLMRSGLPDDLQGRMQWEANVAVQEMVLGHVASAAGRMQRVRTAIGGAAGQVPQSQQELTAAQFLSMVYMRLGEQQNCLENHNAESCLFPIAGGGVHADPSAVRAALVEIEALLAANPNDLRSRWLLNVAHMALGSYPQGVAKAMLIPPEAFESDDNVGRFWDVAPGAGVGVAELAGGVAMEDFDGDGLLDILTSSWGAQDQIRLFLNAADGTFRDATADAGLWGITGGLNLVPADYDNDGDTDVLVLRGAWRFELGQRPNSLLRNDGAGFFEDVTEAAGVYSEHPTQTAAWADYDGDGHLDLLVGNESQPAGVATGQYGVGGSGIDRPAELYRNNGDGTFTNVAEDVGLHIIGFVKAVVWGDIDNDGDPDLFVSRLLEPNQLFRNDGGTGPEDWAFTDISEAAGILEPIASFPAWFWDYDNDGWLDLFVSGYGDPNAFLENSVADVAADYLDLPTNAARPALYRNRGDGTFENAAEGSGIDDVLMAMGANWGDFDNDGWPDAYVGTGEPDYRALLPNRAYRNAGNGQFLDITSSSGLGHLQKGHGVSFGDIDNDGDQDIYHVLGGALQGDWYPNALFENPGHGHRWLTLRLQGVEANAGGIGARVEIDVDTPAGPRTIHHLVGSGGSFGGNSLQSEIGLGDGTTVRSVRIRWPGSGTEDTFTDVEPDAVYVATEGAASLQPIELPVFDLAEPHLGGGDGAGGH